MNKLMGVYPLLNLTYLKQKRLNTQMKTRNKLKYKRKQKYNSMKALLVCIIFVQIGSARQSLWKEFSSKSLLDPENLPGKHTILSVLPPDAKKLGHD